LGFKPALLVLSDDKAALLCKGYPYITEKEFPALSLKSYLFFQDETLKEEFLKKYQPQSIERYGVEYHTCLGETLGLPPLAIQFFLRENELYKKIGDREQDSDQLFKEYMNLRRNEAFLNYCGVRCGVNIEELEENVKWLWKQYGDVKMDMVSVEYKNTEFFIPYEDGQKLRETKKILLEAARYIQFNDRELKVIYDCLHRTLENKELYELHPDVKEILRRHYELDKEKEEKRR